MTLTLELNGKLTAQELEQVKSFAEFLLTRRSALPIPAKQGGPSHRVSFDGWAGSLAGVRPELSDSEFKQLMRDERVRGADK